METKLRLIKGGVRPERIDEAKPITRAELGLSEADRIVLWVGRLDPIKGLEALIDAFAQLPSALNAHLMLAGDGPLRETLERQEQRANLGESVHPLGSRDDVPSLLKSADVVAFPSRTEGLPNALLEAMAAGCPIVTTNVPGCRDLIEHDVSGLVVPYGDTGALRSALQRLLEDSEAAGELGREATQVARSDWPISRTYDEYARLYAEVLAGD